MGLCFVAGIAFVYSCGGGSSSSAGTIGELEDRVLALENKLTPAYDSGWLDIAQAQHLSLEHNVGGNAGDYIVDVKQWSSSTIGSPPLGGISNRFNGTSIYGADQQGVYWYINSLDDGTPFHEIIWVYRDDDDSYAEKIRVRIWDLGS